MSERAIAALKLLVGTPPAPITGTVTDVNPDAGTCDVQPNDGGAPVLGARLRAVLDDVVVGLLLVPKVGADVVLLPLDEHSYAVVLASELSEVRVNIASMALLVSAAGIKLNDGRNGGLPLITPLASLLNQMIAQGTALATALTALTGVTYPQVSPTTEAALSNPSITQ